MARKRRFHRSAPDRGWIVGSSQVIMNFPNTDPDHETAAIDLFDFADIDPEALTGRIEQDKSDWFVKRMLLNISLLGSFDGLDEYDNTRFISWAVGTIGIANATELESGSNGYGVIGSEAYNLWSRLFQTGIMPVYMPAVVPYGVGNPSNNIAPMTLEANQIPGSGGPDPAGWLMPAPFWGPSLQTFDFTVSNAGLRNNQVCSFAISTESGPSPLMNWVLGDQVACRIWYQVLVQKRRE